MNPRVFAVVLLVSLLAWVGIIWGATALFLGNDGGSAQVRIEEDDPAWDCRTMGDQRCGTARAA